MTKNLAILLFPDAELLDFCGPYEVFSVAARQIDPPAFNVFTVAQSLQPVLARNGLPVIPHYDFGDCPQADLLLIPGGIGTRKEMNNSALIDWITQTAARAELTMSVCTGALLLAKAGLLEGLEATTHHVAYELLQEIAPRVTVHRDRRFVDNGKIITSAGIAAGIDMSLHIVDRLLGGKIANATAIHMEYPWKKTNGVNNQLATIGEAEIDRLERFPAKMAALLGDRDPLDVLAATSAVLEQIIHDHSADVLRTRPFEGKWTPNEILGHLVDNEFVAGFRFRGVLFDEQPIVTGYDQERWVSGQAHNDAAPAEFVKTFRLLRQTNLRLWRSLSEVDLRKIGHRAHRGPESISLMLRTLAGHDLSHLDQLRRYIAAIMDSPNAD